MFGNKNLIARIVISARDEASSVFTSLQAKVAAVATAIAGFFGISLFRASVESARSLESAMSAVQAAAGATADEMATLEAAAKEAGASTQYSAVEAAGALEELVKAGLSASEAVEALPAALDLATAGGVGLAEAAGFLTQAVAGLGLTFEDAGRVADVLAQGANASQTSVEGLAQALSYAAPMANSLGLSLEDTIAYLGKFADAGIDAGRAGTGLNSIMAQFMDPASTFREALRQAGISTTDFNQAIRQMAEAGPGAERALLAVGMEAGPALRALLNQGIGALDDLRGKLLESEGSARTFAATMSANLDGAFAGLGSAWEALKISLGEPVLDTLTRQVTAVATQLRTFVSDGTATQFGAAIKEAFESAGKWAADFFGRMDFAKASADMRQYAADLKTTFGDIGNSASVGSGYVGAFFNALQLGFQSLSVGVTLIQKRALALYATILSGAADVADGLSKITFGDLADGYTSTAAKIRAEIALINAKQDELIASADETFAAMEKNGEELFASYARAEAGADQAAAATAALGSSAAGAVPAVDSLGSAAEKLAAETELAGKSFAELGISSQQVAAKLAEISAQTGVTVTSTRELKNAVADGSIAFNEAAGAWGKGVVGLNGLTVAGANAEQALVAFKAQTVAAAKDSKGLADQSQDTAEKIRSLTEQYKAFIAAGDTQGAAGVLVQIEALKQLGKQAKQTSVDVEQSFAALGVTSSAELMRLADEARGHFETIKASGTATTADIQAAFTAYAEKAIAANNGVVEANLKAQAAQAGLRVEADETGKVIVQSMSEARAATIEIEGAAKDAAAGMSTLGKAAAGAAAAGTTLAETWDEAGNLISEGMDKSVSAGRDAGELVGLYSEQQIRAIRTIDKALQEHTQNILRNHNERILAAGAEERALNRLADQQGRLSSSAARGVDDLKLRLIELSGTEDEIARARLERDKADIARQIALAQLEIKRAMVRGESGEAARLREEIALLQEQLVLVDKVFKAEQRNAKNPERPRGGAGGGMSSGSSSSGGSNNTVVTREVLVKNQPINMSVTMNIIDSDPARLARKIEPELKKLERLRGGVQYLPGMRY